MMLRHVFLILVCSVLAIGCGDCSFETGSSIDSCRFHDTLAQDIDSDDGKLKADVICGPKVECGADRRDLLRGTELEYKIVVPQSELGDGELRVASTGDETLTVSLTRIEDDPCDGSKILHGTAEFHGLGEAALVVYAGDEEIDRYTTTTYEADHLELTAYQSSEVLESLSIAEPRILQLSVLSEDGARLVGGYDYEWDIEDTSVAEIDDTTGEPRSLAVLVPVELGTTVLRLRSSGLMLEIPLEVTGMNLPDSGVAEED